MAVGASSGLVTSGADCLPGACHAYHHTITILGSFERMPKACADLAYAVLMSMPLHSNIVLM